MGDPLDFQVPRPVKRIKQEPPYSFCSYHEQKPPQSGHYPVGHASSVPLGMADGPPRNNSWPHATIFDPSWKWPLSATHFAPPAQSSTSATPSRSQPDFASTSPSDLSYSSQPIQFTSRRLVPSDSPSTSGPAIIGDGLQPPLNIDSSSNDGLQSPFRDCVGTFGKYALQLFNRPIDGKVNGYIKFSWANGHAKQPSSCRAASISDGGVVKLENSMEVSDESASQTSMANIGHPRPYSRSVDSSMEFTYDFSNLCSQLSTGNSMPQTPTRFTPSPVLSNSSTEVASMGAPKMLPSQYGYEAKMDDTDRRFWMFYIRNWCPGRSVLEDTNLWLKDFAQMHKSTGVRSAIQSLAGIYIYDYLPLDSIRLRVNQRFSDAEDRLSQLLRDPATAKDEVQANELITIAVILSMQDIVLTERRLKKPFSPRWLQGFRQGEQFLQSTDHGPRFWEPCNVQSSSLRTSQTIIVGRAVILAQPMSSLPPPNKFDTQKEAARFGWLLYGTKKDMYQIHGGCGFSKKLLHVLSQITYCASRLLQEAESPVVSMTVDYLYEQLCNMRQWSSESNGWDEVKSGPAVIAWVHSKPEGYKIGTNSEMTDATAEAWRFAAILYLQCRVYRLPRNHREVISKLDDLAKCIEIMPTSGSQFTAQAPLFPVFLLGILATLPKHKRVSSNWFDEVLQTPVRSSVPPLHKALQNIWSWIGTEIPVLLPPNFEMTELIHLREPWWEKLVTQAQQQEQELLCLT